MSPTCSSFGCPAVALVKGKLSGLLKCGSLQGHQPCIVDLKLWTIHKESLY